VGLFPDEEPSVHITALWKFLVTFYPPATTCQDQNRQKLFYQTLGDMEKDHS
jgi:hypothetical protein